MAGGRCRTSGGFSSCLCGFCHMVLSHSWTSLDNQGTLDELPRGVNIIECDNRNLGRRAACILERWGLACGSLRQVCTACSCHRTPQRHRCRTTVFGKRIIFSRSFIDLEKHCRHHSHCCNTAGWLEEPISCQRERLSLQGGM